MLEEPSIWWKEHDSTGHFDIHGGHTMTMKDFITPSHRSRYSQPGTTHWRCGTQVLLAKTVALANELHTSLTTLKNQQCEQSIPHLCTYIVSISLKIFWWKEHFWMGSVVLAMPTANAYCHPSPSRQYQSKSALAVYWEKIWLHPWLQAFNVSSVDTKLSDYLQCHLATITQKVLNIKCYLFLEIQNTHFVWWSSADQVILVDFWGPTSSTLVC